MSDEYDSWRRYEDAKAFKNKLAEIDQLKDRIEKLEAALRVYAEEDHWSGDTFEPIRFPEGECKCCYEHFSDQGEIARKALEGKDD
jgi:hypothetical protein